MSLPPITIPLLDPAGPVDPDNDLLLIRQGLNDRKIFAGDLMNTRLGGLSMLPGQLVASDVLLIGRNNGAGYDNYIMPPQYLGFLNGTRMWFYQGAAPLGWTVIPNVGDRLLAVSDITPLFKYKGANAPAQVGLWQQEGVNGGVPGAGLTLLQIPLHNHTIKASSDNLSGANADYARTGKADHDAGTIESSYSGGGTGGQGQPHNHGDSWRPAANVGILCEKNKLVGE